MKTNFIMIAKDDTALWMSDAERNGVGDRSERLSS